MPISSSGHLVLLKHLLGVDLADMPLLMDAMLHLGTLVAVFAVFNGDLRTIGVEFGQAIRNEGLWSGCRRRPYLRLVSWMILATIPAVVVALTLSGPLLEAFGSVRVVGLALLVNGLVLFSSYFAPNGRKDVAGLGIHHAILIGLVQAVALTPGISRSGITIVAGLYLGLNRDTAGRFSFLIAIPAIIGAVLYEFMQVEALPPSLWGLIGAGFVMSALVGYGSLRLLLRFVRTGRLHWFGIYCMLVGVISSVG